MATDRGGVRIEGLAELMRALAELPPALERTATTSALLAGAEVIRARAAELAPVGTQRPKRTRNILSRNLLRKIVQKRPGYLQAAIYNAKGAPHAHLVEFGTQARPELIVPTRRRVLADGSVIFGARVRHRGTRPRPFLRPAVDEKTGEALTRVGQALGSAITSLAARYNTTKGSR